MGRINEFMSAINSVVWDEEIDEFEFEERWKDVISEFNLGENEWLSSLFELRSCWIPAYFRDSSMAGLVRTTSRSESANFFFDHFLGSKDTLVEFHSRFESAMDRQRHNNAKLNYEGSRSLPSTETPLKIEKDAAEIFTRDVFYDIREEIKGSCYELKINKILDEDGSKKYFLIDGSKNDREFEVKYFPWTVSSVFIWCIFGF